MTARKLTLLEFLAFVTIMTVTVGGMAYYYGQKIEDRLFKGGVRLISEIAAMPMTELCPAGDTSAVSACIVKGDYRLRRYGDNSVAISKLHNGKEIEQMRVLDGSLYFSDNVSGDMKDLVKSRIIQSVVGKSLKEIASSS